MMKQEKIDEIVQECKFLDDLVHKVENANFTGNVVDAIYKSHFRKAYVLDNVVLYWHYINGYSFKKYSDRFEAETEAKEYT